MLETKGWCDLEGCVLVLVALVVTVVTVVAVVTVLTDRKSVV